MSSEFEHQLVEAWQAARAAWPTVDLDLARFTDHIRGRLAPGVAETEALAALCGVDLYLACACLHARPNAAEHLDRAFLAHVLPSVRRVDSSPAFADEVRQLMLEKLLMASGSRPPRLVEYAGTGSLLAWLRVATLRTALNLRRDRGGSREENLDEAMVAATAGEDPELDLIKDRYREAFRAAVIEALATLPSEQRNAMRMHLVGGLTTAKIGQMFQVNQSTVVRWLAAARSAVRERTRELLHTRLQLSMSEFDSLAALLLSRLDVSVATVLRSSE
jgi:RNA polymerase sigma-70 factor (ECF subfamily)